MRDSGGQVGGRHRPASRSHVAAAVAALLVSAGFHLSLVAVIDTLPGFIRPSIPPQPRYKPIEMADVRMQPPPPMEKLETVPLDRPSAELPVQDVAADAVQEIEAPEPLKLPLPAVVPEQVPAAPVEGSGDLTPAFRQEIVAIQDQAVADEVAALPRRWVEQDIPRIEQAPDIQLPMAVVPEQSGTAIPEPARSAFVEDHEAGTPDWAEMMMRPSSAGMEGVATLKPLLPSGAGGKGEALDERPEEISSLTAIDDLLQIRIAGHAEAGGSNLYVAIQIEPVHGGVLAPLPRDILFIQDCSESMTPWKLDECRRGLKRWLDFLNPGDRFEVMGFRETTYACFGEWTDFDGSSKTKALSFIEDMRASGDTDVYASLQAALSRRLDGNRTPMLVLVTDGRPTVGVIGSSEIIEGITRFNQGRVAMFAVGGGRKVNSFFLDLVSYRNRGDAVVAKGEEEIPGAMETWARQLQRPVLTDLSFTFSKVDPSEIYPKQLSHLFLDRPLVIHGRFPADTRQIVFQVVGRAGDRWHDMVFAVDRDAITPGDAAIRDQWAWQKVYHMIGDYLADATEARLESIRSFAESYSLLVPYGFSRALPRSGER